jgi:hypothetical protein
MSCSSISPDHNPPSSFGITSELPVILKVRTQDREGTLEPVDQIDNDVYRVAGGAIAGGLGLAKSLFARDDEIHLPVGTKIEMVLEKPLPIEERSGRGRVNVQSTTTVMPRFRLPRSASLLSAGCDFSRPQVCASEVAQSSPKIHAWTAPWSCSSRRRFWTAIRMSPPAPLEPYPWISFTVRHRCCRASASSRSSRASAS